MRHIFSREFRKDFIQHIVQYHCIHRHNVVLCIKIWQLITDFLSGFCTRIFTALSSHFLQKSVTKISLFWNFLSRNRWFFPLHRPVRLFSYEIQKWVIFRLFCWFLAILYRAGVLETFEWVLTAYWCGEGKFKNGPRRRVYSNRLLTDKTHSSSS